MTDSAIIEHQGQKVEMALDQLLNINMAEVPEYIPGPTPAGSFQWVIDNAEAGIREFNDSESPTGKTMRPFVSISCTAEHCFELADKTQNPMDAIGVEHTEMYIIRDVMKSLGRIVAMANKTGLSVNGSLAEVAEQMKGHRFCANIKQSKSRNKDDDRVWANFDEQTWAPAMSSDPRAAQPANYDEATAGGPEQVAAATPALAGLAG